MQLQSNFPLCHSSTLQRHYTENSNQIFPEMKLCGLVSNSYVHVSVSDLYIPTIGLPILLQEKKIGGPIVGIYKSLTDSWMWNIRISYSLGEYINRIFFAVYHRVVLAYALSILLLSAITRRPPIHSFTKQLLVTQLSVPLRTYWEQLLTLWAITRVPQLHCKKSLSFFPSPAWMSLTKLPLAGNNLIIPGQGEFPGWEGKNDNLFYSV